MLFNDGLRTASSITEGLGAGTAITTKALPELGAAYSPPRVRILVAPIEPRTRGRR